MKGQTRFSFFPTIKLPKILGNAIECGERKKGTRLRDGKVLVPALPRYATLDRLNSLDLNLTCKMSELPGWPNEIRSAEIKRVLVNSELMKRQLFATGRHKVMDGAEALEFKFHHLTSRVTLVAISLSFHFFIMGENNTYSRVELFWKVNIPARYWANSAYYSVSPTPSPKFLADERGP